MQRLVKKKLEENGNEPKVVFLFYYFETTQSETLEGDVSVKIHEPNLCIVHQICTLCMQYDTNLVFCHACGIRRHIFRNDPVKNSRNNL